MPAFHFQTGWYYMVGVDKPGIVSVDMVLDEVEDMGFVVHTYGECEKFGAGGQMPFPTPGAVCGQDYDWVGLAERVGPDVTIDLPTQVKWVKGWPVTEQALQKAEQDQPPEWSPELAETRNFSLYAIRQDLEEPLWLGWFQGTGTYAQMLLQRITFFNQTTETGRAYTIVPESTTEMLSLWQRFKNFYKGFVGRTTWYDLYWVPVQTPGDYASRILAKIFMGYVWLDDSGLNDFYCDLGELLPLLVMRDYKRNRWITNANDLPLIHDLARGAGSLIAGRVCR